MFKTFSLSLLRTKGLKTKGILNKIFGVTLILLALIKFNY